ncbi:hypothetical protein F4802DRAFT_126891 [Xylaria palmicola]|nr:hypothetical protein F4802DRAFT_126891 [Xylaria palmicola]
MVVYTFFDLFRNDFSFSVRDSCMKQHIDLAFACNISFDGGDGAVSAYGNVTRSHPLAANPDLAGLGIWIGLTTGILLSFLAVIFYSREVVRALVRRKGDSKLGAIGTRLHIVAGSEITRAGAADHIPFWTRFYRVLRALVMLTADTQSVLALAYGINFGTSGKCTTSAYHYSMGLSTILCACTSVTFSVLIVHDYWRARVAAFLRFSVAAVIFAVLIRFQVYQYYRGFAAEPVGWFFYEKPAGSVDSTVLVPIACFLDPELNPLTGLSNAQIRRVGGRYNSRSQPEIYFSVSVAVIFFLGHLKHWLTHFREWVGSRPGDIDRRKAWYYTVHRSYNTWWLPLLAWGFPLAGCIFAYVTSWTHMQVLRNWVHGSGWMAGGFSDKNPERDLTSLGQVIPIVTLIWIVINTAEAWRLDSDSATRVINQRLRGNVSV